MSENKLQAIVDSVNEARNEALRFVKRSKEALEALAVEGANPSRCKELAAARRASLDLTKALTKIRQRQSKAAKQPEIVRTVERNA